jgi:hypothetical protein
MSIDTGTSYDTASTGVAGPNLGTVNWDDYVIQSTAPQEQVFVNISRPRSMPATFKLGSKPIKDVFAGSAIPSASRTAVQSGTAVLVEAREVWIDSTITDAPASFPVRCTITLAVPNIAAFSADDAKKLLVRTVNGFVASSGDDAGDLSAGLNNLTRGVLHTQS